MRPQRPPFQHRNGKNFHRPEGGSREQEPGLENQSGEDAVKREAAYLRRLADDRTQVEVHMRTGESLTGFIEYYDRQFIRLTRKGAPNMFIYKKDIKYLAEA